MKGILNNEVYTEKTDTHEEVDNISGPEIDNTFLNEILTSDYENGINKKIGDELESLKDRNYQNLFSDVKNLIERMTEAIKSHPILWEIYGLINESIKNNTKAIDCYLRECRLLKVN